MCYVLTRVAVRDSGRWQANKGTPEGDMVQNIPERLGEGRDQMGESCRWTGGDGDKLLPDVPSCTAGTESKSRIVYQQMS